MDIASASTGKLVENGTAAAVGFFSFVSTATQKFTANAPLFSKQRIEDALACVVGAPAINMIDSSYASNRVVRATPSLMRAFNPTTFYGIGTLVADWAAKEVLPAKYYKSIPILPDAVHGAGIGLLVGGIIGGIFDPPAAGYTATSPSPVTGFQEGGVATGNVPYGRAGSTNKIYANGSVLA